MKMIAGESLRLQAIQRTRDELANPHLYALERTYESRDPNQYVVSLREIRYRAKANLRKLESIGNAQPQIAHKGESSFAGAPPHASGGRF